MRKYSNCLKRVRKLEEIDRIVRIKVRREVITRVGKTSSTTFPI